MNKKSLNQLITKNFTSIPVSILESKELTDLQKALIIRMIQKRDFNFEKERIKVHASLNSLSEWLYGKSNNTTKKRISGIISELKCIDTEVNYKVKNNVPQKFPTYYLLNNKIDSDNFVKVTNEFLDSELEYKDKLFAIQLYSLVYKDNYIFLKRSEIEKKTNNSKATLRKKLKDFEEKGYIEINEKGIKFLISNVFKPYICSKEQIEIQDKSKEDIKRQYQEAKKYEQERKEARKNKKIREIEEKLKETRLVERVENLLLSIESLYLEDIDNQIQMVKESIQKAKEKGIKLPRIISLINEERMYRYVCSELEEEETNQIVELEESNQNTNQSNNDEVTQEPEEDKYTNKVVEVETDERGLPIDIIEEEDFDLDEVETNDIDEVTTQQPTFPNDKKEDNKTDIEALTDEKYYKPDYIYNYRDKELLKEIDQEEGLFTYYIGMDNEQLRNLHNDILILKGLKPLFQKIEQPKEEKREEEPEQDDNAPTANDAFQFEEEVIRVTNQARELGIMSDTDRIADFDELHAMEEEVERQMKFKEDRRRFFDNEKN